MRKFCRAGKFDNCIQGMIRYNIKILWIAATRWIDSGIIDKDQNVMYFYGGQNSHDGIAMAALQMQLNEKRCGSATLYRVCIYMHSSVKNLQ